MKLITRCTQCHTSFRVHDHQLAVRQGRVRCGACGHVFDAYSTLTEQPEDEHSAYSGEWQSAGTTASAAEAHGAGIRSRGFQDPISLADPIFDVGSARAPDPPLSLTHEARLEHGPRREHPPETASSVRATFNLDDLALAPPARATAAGTDGAAFDIPPEHAPAAAETPSYSIADPISQAPSEPQAMPAPQPDAPEQDFNFGPRRASRRARIGMGIAAGVLALVALGQLVFATRSYIAAWAPNARPVLEDLCTQLGCEVPHLRRTEAVLLDSSELEREEAGLLTLHAVIRNTSMFEQALPSLLLTLLDDRNRAIARRVVEANDYVADSAPNKQVLPASGTVQATVYLDASKLGQTAANYEVMVFYR